MKAEYFAGKWNDHDIILAVGKKQNLLFDGKIIAEDKPLKASISGEIPTESKRFVHILCDECNCFCIVGVPLETSYDKSNKNFTAEYVGHKIEVSTKKMNYTLLVDGMEADKKDVVIGGVGTVLGTSADENGKRVVAVFETGFIKGNCQCYAEAENVRMIPCQKQGGELIPVNPSDGDGFAVGFMLGMSI